MDDAPDRRPQYAWFVVLCLLGLDYFSSLAYLPSLALWQARALPGEPRALAPIAALGVVVLTLFAVLPVYLYVVGRSHQGHGAVWLLEQRWPGWGGKLLVLILLGFVATDYVVTRSLSTANAAEHLTSNPLFRDHADGWGKNPAIVRDNLPAWVYSRLNEKVIVSVVLAVISFGLYFYLVRSLSRGFLGFAVAVVIVYMALNAFVVGSSLSYLWKDPQLLDRWQTTVSTDIGDLRANAHGVLAFLLIIGLVTFPPMAIGLSGFELSLASVPMVRGSDSDDPAQPGWRIFNARLMMIVAAVLMSFFVLASVFVVSLLVPDAALFKGDIVQHRALSHLAHGGLLTNGQEAHDVISPVFGELFGTFYDLSTIVILCLAGATATITFRDMVPEFLSKFGMQLSWAKRIGVITHLFNGLILVVTVVFKANVSDLMWTYATSVLALMFGAALAARIDLQSRFTSPWVSWLVSLPFRLIGLVFLIMMLMVVVRGSSGVLIAGVFVLAVLGTAIFSRWLRGTEPRFDPFTFAPDGSEERFLKAVGHEFQVLVPHVPGGRSLDAKEAEIRRTHRLSDNVPILFVEVSLGDPSDYHCTPLLTMAQVEGRDVICVSKAASVPHTLAAVALKCREVGVPPEMHFAWSDESAMEANWNFVLLGQGNVPAMVREILRKAEPDSTRRPRVVVG